MCLIIVAKDKKPTLEVLTKGSSSNNDGCGAIWLDNGKANFKKGFRNFMSDDIKKFYEFTQTLPLPFIVHLRNASVGLSKELSLTHPFVISNDSPLLMEGQVDKLLVHNGTILRCDWEWLLNGANIQIKTGELMSDSRALAMTLSVHQSPSLLERIKGNFVYVDSTKEKGRFIIIGDSFKQRDGIIYSNMDWENKTYNSCGKNENPWSEHEYNMNHSSTDLSHVSGANQKKTERFSDGLGKKFPYLTAGMSRKQAKRYRKRLEANRIRNQSIDVIDVNVNEVDEVVLCFDCENPINSDRLLYLHNLYGPKKEENKNKFICLECGFKRGSINRQENIPSNVLCKVCNSPISLVRWEQIKLIYRNGPNDAMENAVCNKCVLTYNTQPLPTNRQIGFGKTPAVIL